MKLWTIVWWYLSSAARRQSLSLCSTSHTVGHGLSAGPLGKEGLQPLGPLGLSPCPCHQAPGSSELISGTVRPVLHLTILFRVKVFLPSPFLPFVKEKKGRINLEWIPCSWLFVGSRCSQEHTRHICLKAATNAQRQGPLLLPHQGHPGGWGFVSSLQGAEKPLFLPKRVSGARWGAFRHSRWI